MKEKKTMKMLAGAFALTLIAGTALAHGPVAARFGGQITEVGDLRVEFIVRDGGIRAWVTDHADKPVPATGKATLLAGGKKLDLTLKAEGDGLTADAPVNAADKITAVLNLTAAGAPVSARFAQEAVAAPPLHGPAANGAKVFADICAACHGAALRGTDAGPPLLHPNYIPGAGHGDEIVINAVNNGAKSHHWKFGDMPKPEGVKPGQDRDLLAYIRAMQAANGLTAPAAADPHAGHH